jgi:ACS family tartrate transporter-like MFS transporter
MDDIGQRATKNASRILIPLLLLMYFINYLDRVNIGFAALTMNSAIGITAAQFGIGASIFFVGYVVLEVPSNMALAKIGARRWIARIMISWGIVSVCMTLVSGAYSFYLVRFLLGVAEAGFFPGIIFFLTNWFPSAFRARVVGLFMVGIPLSGLVGAPLSTLVMSHLNGIGGLQGWQWMFIVEGLPAVILGFVCLWTLPDRPNDCMKLAIDERQWLEAAVEREKREQMSVGHSSVMQSITNRHVLALAAILFLITSALYGSIFWIPQFIKTFNASNAAVGWIAAIPYFAAVPGMILWSRHSDQTGERQWHVAGPLFVSALGFIISGSCITIPSIATLGLCVGCCGIYASFPIFWSLPASFLSGTAAAAAIAFIAAVGNFSGIVAPALIGWSKDLTGGFGTAMFGLAAALLAAGLLVIAVQRSSGVSVTLPAA